ncbi:response regulator transcription factor [Geodermatophilus ruber]|uniref:DNA-binding response regulator, OmpR family, contains REC and winged-helix (WHTH) domain n=1 Tax=Geodermatophilus ruber TaxID=504800 RepID=A0A1I4AP59_9ACTN|nr:response regulator transcription factor [Geodermatophilus ruber]SFK58265.1 DNA-binding response regulator, OmpR family, contains REC and winged-helix (wHTH) domain [Geodermatophilus ruber]
MHVLVVEDQPKMQDLLRQGLQEAGFAVDSADDGPAALDRALGGAYDAVVLDVMLPGVDGFEVLRRLREEAVWTPVLMLTARDGVPDRVRGLDAGADDYLVKPFALSELISRVRAVIRRRSAPPAALRCGPLELDPTARTVAVAGTRVELSPREFAVLWLLLQRQGAVVTRADILDQVWNAAPDVGSNVVEVYVRYLRDKIDRRFGVELIHTVRGAGYRLAPPP